MGVSLRKKIIELLISDYYSPSQLSKLTGVRVEKIRYILAGLLSSKSIKVIMSRPVCKSCGRTISVKKHLIPSKCPYCGSERIEEPLIKIHQKAQK